MPDKPPNCYTCQHRRANLELNDAHSSCRHPSFAGIFSDKKMGSLLQCLALVAAGRRPQWGPVHMVDEGQKPIHVTGHPHGIKKGWFNWPFSYDPIWLLSCTGYTPKEACDADIEHETEIGRERAH